MNNLPTLTIQQNNFVKRYFENGHNASEAYRFAYNTNASSKTIWKEAHDLLKNPNVYPWIEFYRQQQQATDIQEINYITNDCLSELDQVLQMSIESSDKNGNPNLQAALKAIELKGKLKGLFQDKIDLSAQTVVQMGEVKLNNETLDFKIGNDDASNSSNNSEYSQQNAANDYGVQ